MVGVAFPLCLAVIARLSPLRGRNALQFLFSSVLSIALWAGLVYLRPGLEQPDLAEVSIALMGLGGGPLFYLEVWGLLSRVYTPGLLLMLQRAGVPLSEAGLERSYRGGHGLAWIMRHRLSGLIGAALVREEGGSATPTPALGVPVALVYKLSIMLLRLRRTG